jgi:TetR/AcrR family transcriptional repressor of nem operon
VRYPPGQREATRARILEAASRLFRVRGYAATGIDAVMSGAELTAGAFYSYFASKDALFAAAMGAALAASREVVGAVEESARVDEFIERYLSTQHRDALETGCALASLGPEAARAGSETKRAVEEEVRAMLTGFEASLRGSHRAERAIAIFALCAGGVVLSRVVVDAALSERVLRACKRAAHGLVHAAG